MSIDSDRREPSSGLMSEFELVKSSATSHPRPRRLVLYETDNDGVCEVGLWYDVKLILTKFRECDDIGLCGYDTGIHHVIGEFVRNSWPDLELLHAKLFLLNYYKNKQVPTRGSAEIIEAMKEFIHDTKTFLNEMESEISRSIKSIHEELNRLIGREMGILDEFIINGCHPNHDLWTEFVQQIHEINFWGLAADTASHFELFLERKYPKCNFFRRIRSRLSAFIDFWIFDEEFLEFDSIAVVTNISDDMSGAEIKLPMDVESLGYNISGTMVNSQIGRIQADCVEMKIGIRFYTENMISATGYNPNVTGSYNILTCIPKNQFKSIFARVSSFLVSNGILDGPIFQCRPYWPYINYPNALAH